MRAIQPLLTCSLSAAGSPAARSSAAWVCASGSTAVISDSTSRRPAASSAAPTWKPSAKRNDPSICSSLAITRFNGALNWCWRVPIWTTVPPRAVCSSAQRNESAAPAASKTTCAGPSASRVPSPPGSITSSARAAAAVARRRARVGHGHVAGAEGACHGRHELADGAAAAHRDPASGHSTGTQHGVTGHRQRLQQTLRWHSSARHRDGGSWRPAPPSARTGRRRWVDRWRHCRGSASRGTGCCARPGTRCSAGTPATGPPPPGRRPAGDPRRHPVSTTSPATSCPITNGCDGTNAPTRPSR